MLVLDAIYVPDPLMLISGSPPTDRRLIQNAECRLMIIKRNSKALSKGDVGEDSSKNDGWVSGSSAGSDVAAIGPVPVEPHGSVVIGVEEEIRLYPSPLAAFRFPPDYRLGPVEVGSLKIRATEFSSSKTMAGARVRSPSRRGAGTRFTREAPLS
ncbi:hypothetical protein MUK42_01633 [Musa troglodytarum]|uniref:Uncharacterized protein n=1 Tax=Musa troglodytarum TaxID=320322 RepID=A0A9E7K4H1_9LILI|nr:hypothetical protein MUK42_01633 [Musa troglodytarum]